MLVTLLMYGTWGLTSCHYTNRIAKIKDNNNATNSFLSGKLEQSTTDKAAAENRLLETTAALNDVKRDRDAEVLRLTTEKESLSQQLTFIHTLPQQAQNVYSNLAYFASTEPTNRQYLTEFAALFTNALHAMELERPQFSLAVNELTLSNNHVLIASPYQTGISNMNVLFVNRAREFTLEVRNLSQATADQVSIDFTSVISGTNWIADGWMPQPGPEHTTHYYIMHDKPLASGSRFLAPILRLKTNVTDILVPVELLVFSSKSKSHKFSCILINTPKESPENSPGVDAQQVKTRAGN